MTSKRIRLAIVAAAIAAVGGMAGALGATGVGSSSNGYSYMYRMMGSGYAYQPARSAPVSTLAGARADAQKFADRLGLRVAEVLQFEDNFYAKLVNSKGDGATEVLVDPQSGLVSIEYGPAMMWNTRYGMGRAAAWMMGGYGIGTTGGSGTMSDATRVSMAEAHRLAQQWLDSNEAGVQVEAGGDAYPGYYTLETLKHGAITGMISINASSGAIWPHWWHGAFIAGWGA
ncbi:MAG: hypothetical protein M0T77_05605 [Actinomycetota bacterium]|nr:hypothetical protein [Actinomycetota bacterium]